MSVDEESYAFGKAKKQAEEMLEEFNEHAPYGLEHRVQLEATFEVPEDQVKIVRSKLIECSIAFPVLSEFFDPKNYSQYRV